MVPTHGLPLHQHCLRLAGMMKNRADVEACLDAAFGGDFGNYCEQIDGFGGVWISLLEKCRMYSRGACPMDIQAMVGQPMEVK